MLKVLDCCRKLNYFNRNISIFRILLNEQKKQPKRKVKETVELVTLVDQDDKILGLKPKVESIKLAKKLNLALERVYDTKYGKTYPAFKMSSASNLLKEIKKASYARVLKKLPLNSRISDNDLSSKLEIIKRWLSKNCEVHVAISKNNQPESTMKALFSKLKEHLKEYRFLDIRHKPEAIKFIVVLPKQTLKQEETNDNTQKEDSKKEETNNNTQKEDSKKEETNNNTQKDSKKEETNDTTQKEDSTKIS